MSYTEIFGFNKKGDAYSIGETKNAWRGAMAIWRSLHQKYYNTEMSFSNLKPVWEIDEKFKMTDTDFICLAASFDNAIILKEDIGRLVHAFKDFEFDTSLKEQAKIIEEEKDVHAIGFNQTSVNGDTWANYGGYDEEKDEYTPYNIPKGKKHWNIFEELKLHQAKYN